MSPAKKKYSATAQEAIERARKRRANFPKAKPLAKPKKGKGYGKKGR
jgi:hypothetical protein